MSKGLFEDFVLRKKAWRKEQARLPMAEKARIVEALRERVDRFPEGSSLPETSSFLIHQGFELCPFFLQCEPVDQIQEPIGIKLVRLVGVMDLHYPSS